MAKIKFRTRITRTMSTALAVMMFVTAAAGLTACKDKEQDTTVVENSAPTVVPEATAPIAFE